MKPNAWLDNSRRSHDDEGGGNSGGGDDGEDVDCIGFWAQGWNLFVLHWIQVTMPRSWPTKCKNNPRHRGPSSSMTLALPRTQALAYAQALASGTDTRTGHAQA